MDELAIVILTVVAAVFILPILALVGVKNLGRRIDALTRDVHALRAQLAQRPSEEPQPDREEARAEPSSEDAEPGADEAPEQPDAELPAEQAPPGSGEPAGPPPPISISMASSNTSPSAGSVRSGNMEQALGTKWTVWIGGLALALGGIFLVRYTIEAGLLGPGVRIALGAIFALSLGLVGEYTRRREVTANLAGVPGAYIPGVLTAAGILTGFATVFAAYALYGFLPPLMAFILLAACSFGALSASWLHGPSLAVLGLIGSYATPALVVTETPKAWPLFIYLLFVTGATYFAARLKGWLWLAISAAVGAVLWGFIWYGGNWTAGDLAPVGVYILALTVISLYFLAHTPGDDEQSDGADDDATPVFLAGIDWPATGILAAITFLVIPAVRLEGYSTPSLLLLGATILLLYAGAWQWRNLAPLTVWSAALFGAIYLTWHLPVLVTEPVGPFDAYLGLDMVLPPALWNFLVVGAIFGGGFAAAGFIKALLSGRHPFWTLTSASTPIVIFAYAYLRATNFEQDVPFGSFALLMSAIYVAASDVMHRRGTEQLWGWRSGCYAAAAVVSLTLACTILLEKGWLTIALALICPGLAWVSQKRPVPGLRYLAAGLAVIVMARLVYDPVIVGDDLGRTPILNWLLYGYGIPAIAFILAAWRFRLQKDDRAVQVLEAAGILCAVVLIGLQIRHALNDGNVYSRTFDLTELSIHSITMIGLAIGLQRLYDRTNRLVVEWAAAILCILGLAALLFGHLVAENPMLTGDPIGGGRVFNVLLLAYVVPVLLCGVLYKISHGRRLDIYVTAIGVTALVLVFAYLTLENRALFHGPVLTAGPTSDAEWYTYSAIWLLYGACLLGAGIVTGRPALRYASLAIIILTVGKVFLSDLAHLSGILRALSFIGLGTVLVGIGFFYQRYVFPQPAIAGEESDDPSSAG